MKKRISKKGLSPVIATVLLIFLVLVLAGIIFLWASGFFSEQLEKNGESVENQCTRVNMEIDLPEGYDGASGQLTVDFVNNGDVGIHGVSVRTDGGGNAVTEFILLNIDPGKAVRHQITLDISQGVGSIEEVTFYPVLLGTVVGESTNKKYTCVENPQRRKL